MGLFGKLFGNTDKESASNQEEANIGTFDKFLKIYPPSSDLIKPTQEMLDWYADKLPAELLDFWKEYGFGNYGNGIIKVVEPSHYMDSFYEWIGKKDFSKLPILVSAFGDIFYYRKLTEDAEDVSLLDIHYRKISVCDYSLESFFKNYITDPEIAKELLKPQLFETANKDLGGLTADEIYFFNPALIMGGAEEQKYLGKGIGSVHQSLLFQLGL
ncbi:GAD-like domain-containing protein [Soonwooa sp.]|uniref:GAD-like domain-containing protein n=1 Tax=Soonwooa sp. TaxID=1938592 RepID=UPI002619B351|nr:GAD-like domain-containing protein [Soonwooa sp.]